MTNIHVAGVAMTKFGPNPQATVKSLTSEAVAACLIDAGAAPNAVEAV